MALFRNDNPGALTLEQAIRKAHWLEELQRRRTAAEAYRRQGRPAPPELEDETPPEDFSTPEEFKRFTNDSPGALTLDQAVERHMAFLEKAKRRIVQEREAKAQAKARTKTARMAEQVAAEGRGSDTEVAHVTPGEMVIPRVFQTPEVLAALAKVAAAQGVPLERFCVGDARNNVNPQTGAPEFWFDGFGSAPGFFGDGGSPTNSASNRATQDPQPSMFGTDACQNGSRVVRMNVTAYTSGPESTGKRPGDPGYGETAGRTLAGPGTLAAPSAYKFGTKMYVPGYGWGIVSDRGGAIQGNHLDIWFETVEEARRWGRRDLDVTVCND